MVDRFTSVIDAFDDASEKLSLDQIALRARLPRSTTHRLLDQLVRLNWLRRAAAGYMLGSRLAGWGAQRGASMRLRQAAAPPMHNLHRATNAVVHLGLLDGSNVVHIDKVGGACAAAVPTSVGTRARARTLALGLAILAAQPPDAIADATLSDELARIRRNGAAVHHGDYTPRLTSVAAAIDDRSAVGIVVPHSASAARYRPLVVMAAFRIRSALR